ncbi:MFS transporter [Acinetobacter baumannii]|uniref:MFS transporter n=2 Tax=Acinetobacter baumannii TaxID=470 RepID=UPI0002AEC4D7|nr:MFS transporter [Acinetobacter baumannii]AHB89762.1 MFS family transporter [Acinetobacter baumannii ZW85-1]ELW90604.1 transporter, major facilitator family protein [Acinetobacter baumannii AA-014]MBD0075170.1 MFS transporter [Acinetobacter baumannii]MBD0085480.1 MFS transporter [Acinetobacter baumannii]MBD0115553.1 MFS transporter [Acinetobacter baumannii]
MNTQSNTAFSLLALAIGAFAIGTTEFSPMGLLPNIANDLGISIPTAGMLITGYALGVMLGAPFMTLWFGGFARRNALIFLMAIFTVGNLIAAFSPNYMSLLGARLITSLNHGAFFGIGSVVAASIVPAHKQASAVATMFMGLTIANIGGVPLATWVGQNIGWRMSFLAISVLGIITMLALWKALPQGMVAQKPNVKAELKVLTRTPVVLALLTTVLGAGAMFTLYTYIAPSLTEFMHASPTFITFMLVLIGVGFSIGNHLGGRFADLSINKTLIGFLVLLIVMMVTFPILAQSQIGAAIALVIWGAATFALVPPLQMRVMSVAHEAPGLASSVNIGAFNLGNAVGAAAGALVLDLGWGYSAVSFAGALLAGLGLLLVLFQIKRESSPAQTLQQCSD